MGTKTPVEYTTPAQKADDGILWNDVKPGDLLMGHNGTRYFHTMVIDAVDMGTPHDLYYSAHSSHRSHKKLLTVVPTWKTGTTYRVICLPDAPITIKRWTISGGSEIWHLWGTKWDETPSPGVNAKKQAGKAKLEVQLRFDCDMKTNESATVSLKLGQTINFTGKSTTGWTNGWRTGASVGDWEKDRTWRGYINANDLPDEKNKLVYIWINAKGADGTETDTDNELDEYVGGTCKLMRIKLDTRKPKAKSK